MARRNWLVRPDRQFQTLVPDGDGGMEAGPILHTVSQEALAKALVDAAILLDRAGGVVEVVTHRAPTGVEGERVTTSALVSWRNRTDARAAPERDAPAEASEPEPVPELVGADAPYLTGVAVDESDVPEHLRGQ